MKPFYSIDAGEFIVGSIIENRYPSISIWFPAKDSGDDLLLYNREKGVSCTLQVKVSRDYLITHMDNQLHPHLKSCGWFTPKRSKIENSESDFWILGLHSYHKNSLKSLRLIIIQPTELLHRYDRMHGKVDQLHSYLWLTKDERVIETRGLGKKDKNKIINGDFIDKNRNFSVFLDNWLPIEKKLKINLQ